MTENIIQVKLKFITDKLKDLKICLENIDKGSLDEKFLLLAGERLAEEIIESAISINQIILKEKCNHIADNYFASFIDLQKVKIFEQKELMSFAKTASFRNRLAHDYLNLDKKITIKSFKNILKIYPEYVKQMSAFWKKD